MEVGTKQLALGKRRRLIFIDKSLKENFDILKEYLVFQRDIVEKIFISLEGNSLLKIHTDR